MILAEGTCVVDIARRVVTPRATLAGTWGTRERFSQHGPIVYNIHMYTKLHLIGQSFQLESFYQR